MLPAEALSGIVAVMDILTQGLIGGVLAQAVARPREKKIATLAGLFAGLLADADILIRSSGDPLLNIEYHRHFTHSLLFIPFGAAIAALLLWPLLRRHLPLRRLYLFCLAGFSLSGFLDALTSYGTMLFWPFSEQRIAFNLMPIVDPLFTLILLLSLILGLWRIQQPVTRIGLLLCLLYIGVAFVQQQRAFEAAQQLAGERGHEPRRPIVKPTLGNLLLWRSVYLHEGRIYVDAVRVGILAETRVYAGQSVPLFRPAAALPALEPDSVLANDIRRFSRFSEGYVARDPEQSQVLGDIRYSMLPNSVRPLWGIVIDPGAPQTHVDYRFFRENTPALRQTFMAMLQGDCDLPECRIRAD